MAVSSGTVQVVMPAMGDSVAEGTVLEWHKQEGDAVQVDETLVEISTDKVDAEVPAPAAGRIVKIHAAEGETVAVGAVLAEISTNGDGAVEVPATPVSGESPPATAKEAVASATTEAEGVAAVEAATGETIDIVTPTGGESVTEGTILEWSVKVGDAVKQGATVVEISTDKVDMELPAPASGTITEILAQDGETVSVGQVIARMQASAGAAPTPPRDDASESGAKSPAPAFGDGGATPANISPIARRMAAEQGVDLSALRGTARGGRITKADVLAAKANGGNGATAAPAQTPTAAHRAGSDRAGSGARRRAAHPGRRGRARALHGREPLDPHRHLVPHAHRRRARAAPRPAQGGRAARLVHAPDRVRDRARGDRGHGGDGQPLRRDRRQAAPRRRRRMSIWAWPSTSRRRTAAGR